MPARKTVNAHPAWLYRPSSEKICNVEYVVLTIFFQGHVFPTETNPHCFLLAFSKIQARQNARIAKSGFKKVKLATLVETQT